MSLAGSLAWGVAAAALLVAPLARGATDCADRWKVDCATGGPGFGCAAGCLQGNLARFGLPLEQLPDPCGLGGSFNLIGTQYQATCSGHGVGCTVDLPPLRFWDFDNHGGPGGANSGCQLQNQPSATDWILNGDLDGGLGALGSGRWFLYQTTWSGPGIDGCPVGDRTVAEISDLEAAREGTTGHGSWYLVASVDNSLGFNFDRVTGAAAAGGCVDNDVPTSPVPDVLLTGRAAPCRASTVVTRALANATDPSFFDVLVELASPTPPWFNETGIYGDPPLIAGFQIVYASGAEPSSSDPQAGGYRPVRDPLDPARARAVVPFGTVGPIVVTLPEAAAPHWLATRLVYAAGSAANPLGSFDPATEPGPRVTSPVGGHCGPVETSRPDLEITKAALSPTVQVGRPVDFVIAIRNTGTGPFTGGRLTDTLDACFDRLADCAPVVCAGGTGCGTCAVTPAGFTVDGYSLAASDGAAGGPDEMTFTVTATAGTTPGPCANRAVTSDPDSPSLVAGATVDILAPSPDLVIRKLLDPPGQSPAPGDAVIFLITVTNQGLQPMPSGTLTDRLDASGCMTVADCSAVACAPLASCGACTPTVTPPGFTQDFVDLAPGGSVTFTVSAVTDPDIATTTSCTNTAETSDPDPAVEKSQATVTITPVPLPCDLMSADVTFPPATPGLEPPRAGAWVYGLVCAGGEARLPSIRVPAASPGVLATEFAAGTGGTLRLYQIDCGCALGVKLTKDRPTGKLVLELF